MPENEKRFKKVMNKIGIAMLLFLAFINIFSALSNPLTTVFKYAMGEEIGRVVGKLAYSFLYLLSFVLPACILMGMVKKDGAELMLERKLPKDAIAYILASISIVYTFAVINSYFVSVFGYSDFSSEYLWGNEAMTNTDLMLELIGTAMVPAVCEEILFRGAILSALKPYGKTPSIIISAILFGLMHQNAEQLLYTTVAGILLAWVVYETGSIWCSILIHFFNNFIGVFENALSERVNTVYADSVILIFEGLIFLSGVISIAYLLTKKLKNKENGKIFNGGFYKKNLNASDFDGSVKVALSAGRITRLFFSPTVIVFTTLSVLTMIAYILMSLLHRLGVLTL